MWGVRAEFAANLTKGAHVPIGGKIRTCEYMNGDMKRTVAEIRVFNLSNLDRPTRSEAGEAKGAISVREARSEHLLIAAPVCAIVGLNSSRVGRKNWLECG